MGFRTVYQPKSVVIHYEGITHGNDLSKGIKQKETENKNKFVKKWQSELNKKNTRNPDFLFQARDKSNLSSTVLVIDHYVPHFDKDAGSRSTYMYLKRLVEKGLNVKFIGDNFFRHEPYTTQLEQLGIEVLVGNYYAKNWKNWILKNAQFIDTVYMHRPHITRKYIEFIKQNL